MLCVATKKNDCCVIDSPFACFFARTQNVRDDARAESTWLFTYGEWITRSSLGA